MLSKGALHVRELLPGQVDVARPRRMSKRYRQRDRENDFVSLLYCLSSAIRVGRDPLQALSILRGQFCNSSMEEPLQVLQSRIQEGVLEEEAFREFGRNIACADSELFVTAYLLSRKQGGSLSPFLKQLASVLRQRQRLRRKKKSALAMQRLSAIAMSGCALLIVCMQCVFQYEALVSAWHDQLGRVLLLGAACCIVSGMGWMWYFTREAR